MFLTVPSLSSTAEEKFIKKGEFAGDDSLLDLDPEDIVFYVGGVPSNFKVSYPAMFWLIANLHDCFLKIHNTYNDLEVDWKLWYFKKKLSSVGGRILNQNL